MKESGRAAVRRRCGGPRLPGLCHEKHSLTHGVCLCAHLVLPPAGAVGPDYLAHHISGVTLQHAQRAAGTGSVDNGTAAAAAAAGARSEGGGGALAAGRRPTEAEEHERASLTVYVDLMLLARAHCLVWSKSGFSMVAMVSTMAIVWVCAGGPDSVQSCIIRVVRAMLLPQMLGFNPCTVDVPTCMEENDKAQRADAEAPPVSGTGAAAG